MMTSTMMVIETGSGRIVLCTTRSVVDTFSSDAIFTGMARSLVTGIGFAIDDILMKSLRGRPLRCAVTTRTSTSTSTSLLTDIFLVTTKVIASGGQGGGSGRGQGR